MRIKLEIRILERIMGFGTRKMGDISLPSSCIDSFITPFLRSFSVSLIKKDSYLNENFLFKCPLVIS